MYAAVPRITPAIVPSAVMVEDFDRSGPGPFGREGFCETEVEHLDHPIGRDLDVRGLEIAMDDPGPMGGIERVGDLLRDGQSLRERQRAPAHAIVQRVALDQLEHQGRHLAGVFETVDRPDVRMIERCEQSCFAFEARHAIGVRRERRQQDLQRDVAPKLGVARAIHFAHAAGPEERDDFVWSEPGTRGHRHPQGNYSGQSPVSPVDQTATRNRPPTLSIWFNLVGDVTIKVW